MTEKMSEQQPINVIVRFELEEGDLDKLIGIIQEFFEKEVSTFPGFVSAKFHTNHDQTVLINYATWTSFEAFQAFGRFAGQSPISKKIQAFKSRADIVHEIFHAAAGNN